VSIRAVSERVGKTPPSIYLHFADKDELMLAACERRFDSLARFTSEAQSGLDDPVDRIRACGRAYVQFAIEHPEEYRILFMEKIDLPAGQRTIEALKAHVAFRSLHDNVEDAFTEGRFRGPGPELVSVVLWSAVHGIASLLVAKPTMEWPPVEVLVDQMMDQQLHGLVADGG
jgi:AcrR family transcriptional regulator